VLGLRFRLALALVAASVVTLAAAVGTFVGPLEHRLANDRVRGLRELARTAGLGLTRLPPADLRPGARRPRYIVHQLARRTGARVALFDAHGVELADTDPQPPEPGSAAPERLADVGYARAGDVRQSVTDREATVVAAVKTRAGRRTIVLRTSLDDEHAAVAVVRGALPVAGGVGLAMAVALGTALAFGLLRRLESLRRGARRLAEEGIERPLEVDAGSDMVGEVARALELMRSRLQAQERGRQAFLSTASHELRTPVASLRGTAELLEEELAGPAPDLAGARARAAAVSRQAHGLSTLADDLLGLGRLDASVTLAAEPVEVAELAGTLAAEAEPVAVAAGVALEVDDGGPAWALADPVAVARIVRALLDNALRHGAPAGSTVAVAVASGAPWTVVAVRDEGAGVQERDRERIFGRFERGAVHGAGGFGLGLPIARGLARRMGGDVVLEWTESAGAAFTLLLPACASPLARDGPAPGRLGQARWAPASSRASASVAPSSSAAVSDS
jgi:signal transduction histidine kinase